MTSDGTLGRAGEQAAASASDMGSPSSEGVASAADGCAAAAAACAAPRSPSEGRAALVGVPSAGASRARFVGVAWALFACARHQMHQVMQGKAYTTLQNLKTHEPNVA